MIFSLRGQLALLWAVSLLTVLATGALMYGLYQQTSGVLVRESRAATETACRAITARFAIYLERIPTLPRSARDPDLRPGLDAILRFTLSEFAGVEGGIWSAAESFIAYAYPTYEGSGHKEDVPGAERARIARLAEAAVRLHEARAEAQQGQREALLLFACPLPGPIEGLAAWTMARVPTASRRAENYLMTGVALLFVFVLVSGAWLGRLVVLWSQAPRRLETALAQYPTNGFPKLEPTGVAEFDTIVAALNDLNVRLKEAQKHSAILTRRMAQEDRLAALGRVAARFAHEIRNPVAAMRLKVENALAQPGERQQMALAAILKQVERLDRLVSDLLAMTQPFEVKLETADARAWLEERLDTIRERAQKAGIEMTGAADVERLQVDLLQLGRALDNLLLNALQHTPPGGRVGVTIGTRGPNVFIRVTDTGPGIAPALRERLFEPFVTNRPDGIGLGLVLVREIAEAHGGTVACLPSETGAVFEIELPCPPS